MKRLLFFIIIIFGFTFNLSTQTPYHKMLGDTNRWYVSGLIMGCKNSNTQSSTSYDDPCIGYYEATSDSLYGSHIYKKFLFNNSTGICVPIFGMPFLKSLVREDTVLRKLYMISDNNLTEDLVMDFSLNVGDSIFLKFNSINSTPLYNAYYKVDSIVPMIELIGLRKHFFLSSYNANLNYQTGKKYFIEWIESIGASHFPLSQARLGQSFITAINSSCIKAQYSSIVTCKWTNHVKYYQDSCALKYAQAHISQGFEFFGNTCEFYCFIGGVKEMSFLKQIELFPNPINSNSFTLKFEALLYKPLHVSIYNTLGQQVYFKTINISTTSNSIPFNDFDLQQGLYTLQLKSADESTVIKFIRN